eukprot:c2117_g1_i2.p1 GENE.c2117_g1_i2~~c2117_g1_i2.p1  ORF type:complete len:333 (+),score=82.13 c2117_g1_i2:53-1051(+)
MSSDVASFSARYTKLCKQGIIIKSSLPQHIRNSAEIVFDFHHHTSFIVLALVDDMVVCRSSMLGLNDLKHHASPEVMVQDIVFDAEKLHSFLSAKLKPSSIAVAHKSMLRAKSPRRLSNRQAQGQLVDLVVPEPFTQQSINLLFEDDIGFESSTEAIVRACNINVSEPRVHYKQGYLSKEGRERQSWKKRYCVAKDGLLLYYKTEKSRDQNPRRPQGVLFLAQCTVHLCTHNNREHCLVASCPDGDHVVFAAESREEIVSWSEALLIQSRVLSSNVIRMQSSLERLWESSVVLQLCDAAVAQSMREDVARTVEEVEALRQERDKLAAQLNPQ